MTEASGRVKIRETEGNYQYYEIPTQEPSYKKIARTASAYFESASRNLSWSAKNYKNNIFITNNGQRQLNFTHTFNEKIEGISLKWQDQFESMDTWGKSTGLKLLDFIRGVRKL